VARKSKATRAGSKRRGVPLLGEPGRSGAIGAIVLVVGLGNPGRKYRFTRHNMGRVAAEILIHRSDVLARGKWPEGELTLVSQGGARFLILTPETFMNISGRAVAPVIDRYRLSPEQVLVLHDDIDLPLGDVRVKRGGGTAGHKGLASLVQELGAGSFARIRIGVGRPPEAVDPAEYVLNGFSSEESPRAEKAVNDAADAALAAVLDDDTHHEEKKLGE